MDTGKERGERLKNKDFWRKEFRKIKPKLYGKKGM